MAFRYRIVKVTNTSCAVITPEYGRMEYRVNSDGYVFRSLSGRQAMEMAHNRKQHTLQATPPTLIPIIRREIVNALRRCQTEINMGGTWRVATIQDSGLP